MNPEVIYQKTIDKNQDILPELEDSVFSLTSAERLSIYPGERKKIRTFIQIKIPKGFYGYIFPIKEKVLKQGFYVLPDFIESGSFKDLEVLIWNINSPKSPLLMSDKERFIGDKNKLEISIGEKIAYFSLVPSTNFQIKKLSL